MKTITLNNGVQMPQLGYGVYLIEPEECEHHVLEAIGMGYRLIDTAQVYHNEAGVGNAMLKCGVPREDLFITTKIWVSNAGEKKAADSIEESLRKLRTDYVDLLLIHQPFGDYPGTWRAMERTVKEGKARGIGLSNFYADRFVDLALYANIKPAINQLMTNVFTQRWEDEREMKPYGTRLMAWGPLAQGKENLAACPQLASLAEKYGKTPQQVALRYLLERDIIAILDVFDFSLTREEVESLRPLDKPVPFSRSHRNPEKVRQYWATKA